MSSALVVEDGNSPYVLAAVRSLGRAGLRVAVASPHPNPAVLPSRWTSRWHPTRLPEQDLDGFVADVRTALEEGDYDLVFGADDIELLALSARRAELPAVLPHARDEAVLRAVDKLTLAEAAAAVGVGVPRTVPATDETLAQVRGPVVVKARLHWTPGAPPDTDRHLLVRVCDDADAARRQVELLAHAHGSAVLQELVHGEQIALSVVVDDVGEVHAVSQQRTVLSSLSRTSVRAETTAVEQPLLDGAVRLLRQLGWTGLANLQYLRPPGGAEHLIDLNGRFYGSLALAVGAGADLPAVWARLALGLPPGPRQVGRPGVRFHALRTDLVRARVQRRGGLPADVLRTLAYAPGAVHSTWSLRDPRPAGTQVVTALRRRVPGGRSRA
jgi:predicted ATP-grasp superfamily ATP-dependent carboligase